MKKFYLNLVIILFCAPFTTSCGAISDGYTIIDMRLQGSLSRQLSLDLILRYFEGKPISELIAITGEPDNTKKENGETTYSWSSPYPGEKLGTYRGWDTVRDPTSMTGYSMEWVTDMRLIPATLTCNFSVTFNSNNIITETRAASAMPTKNCGEAGIALGKFGDQNIEKIISEVTQIIRAKRANNAN
ncbi:hypothetical protein [Bartonella sp. HY761]|uniref:hypothetical protein n=1 Tax=Bartonella sp. HY761 TaxID=2979330 RepID=UPI0022021C6D|nr:hypothetical protein [Bartonella sp. HY761]UXN05976.1 hypothetical protein N6A79_11880 [Bartonella sp. HY761]